MAIHQLSALQLSAGIHGREFSCHEVMQAFLQRIAAVNPQANAIVNLQDTGLLLKQAEACDAELARGDSRGWLHGMPLAFKDLIDVAGIPTTGGSPLLKNNIPAHDALLVQRMKAAGGIVIGKTNTPEWGLGSHTFNPVFGATPNAYNPAFTAGGSSGGAAVALALRLLPLGFHGQFAQPSGLEHCLWHASLARPRPVISGERCLGQPAQHRRTDGAARCGLGAAAGNHGRV